MRKRKSLVTGVGSMFGDDQIGWLVAGQIAESLQQGRLSGDHDIQAKLATVPLDIIDWLGELTRLDVIDACESQNVAGTVHRLDLAALRRLNADDGTLFRLGNSSTHDFGLTEVLDLAAQTNRLPETVVIWAVDGQSFELGCTMTPEVEAVAPEVAATILSELGVCSENPSDNARRITGTNIA